MKCTVLLVTLAALWQAGGAASLAHLQVQVKVFEDLSLQSEAPPKQFQFADSQWEFGVIPRRDSDECYVRLSYWFNREALLLFETGGDGGQGGDSEFVLYVGPEHPLKLLDFAVTDEALKKTVCAQKEFFGTGMKCALDFLNARVKDRALLEQLLDSGISAGSLSIAAPRADFARVYKDVWANEDFYDQRLMDRMMWKGDAFAQEHYSPEYLAGLARDVAAAFARDFTQFLDQKQTSAAEKALGAKVGGAANARRRRRRPS